MTATPTIAAHQPAPKRLEEKRHQLIKTATHDVEKYTFIVNSYQPIETNLSAADNFVPIITQRIIRSLARQNPPVLPSTRKCHAVTVQEGGRK